MAHEPHHGHKFPIEHLDKLRDPERQRYLNPETVWTVIGGGPPRIVVDIGVGLGHFAIPFARKIPDGIVFGCDIMAEMLDHLGEVLKSEGVPNVTPIHCQEARIPLGDQLADIVFMSNVHHELHHPGKSLDECRRLLRPGGIVVVIDWKPDDAGSLGPPAEVRIPAVKVREQLETAGFQGIRNHEVLPYHYFLTGEKPGGC